VKKVGITYLVKESYSTILFGQIANLRNGTDTAAHRVNGLESDDLGRVLRNLLELGFEVGEVVVLEDHFLGAGVTDALDHARMVHLVGKDDAAGKLGTERGQGGVVCDVA
jgi:hypothetical protein